MREFHPLTVERIVPETRDSVRIALSVPEELADEYRYLPGQHIPFEIELEGTKLRRTYSICTAPGEMPLEIGVRVQPGGRFSEFAANKLRVGDTLAAMPPTGRFCVDPDPARQRDYVGFAAGSGITPILSIMRSILATEPKSRFILFYGNRTQATTMFIDDLFALKNRYPERLQLNFVFSREEQKFEPMAGRLGRDKVLELYRHFGRGLRVTDAFVCGPDTMITDVTRALIELGMDEAHIHSERFGVPQRAAQPTAPKTKTADHATITVIMDGHQQTFEMHRDDANIVDAAEENGIELPYSCKGGVCATCRTHLRDGRVDMATNYGLEDWEVEQGFVLACQSRPVSDTVTLDYDKM